ncbi:DNA gyrase inhibitor [Zhongshania aliphaticivorans]|uniref:DNA gyrase inhibitor n=1 Tax=Zhongshania aliphaticivorans TaxID=1470434 RepID=A0A5S9P7X5_9GAMM|nr:GyrI-like domain-containing protein [Zhongshania aliphaticivorans]CAA0092020.1 DNA gyrase inhibitor [Zhongshania aliphaticivorans]CAA0099356.1 DNA gyrase inhibitor [Zhongshania aliphaticivorans]
MDVKIVQFQETKVAALEYLGPPSGEHEAVLQLIAWRKQYGYPPSPEHRSYGIHYNNPQQVALEKYRVDLCVSVGGDVESNAFGVVNKIIPSCRCAVVRHVGSRNHVSAAQYLYEQWLPKSKEQLGNFPLFFHYVNVGLDIPEQDMLTDVYLPIA